MSHLITTSRSSGDYTAMFNIDTSFAGRRVLVCPGGGSGAAKALLDVGAHPTLVDPRYALPEHDLGSYIVSNRPDAGYLATQTVDWSWYKTPENMLENMVVGLQEYYANTVSKVAVGLPELPFKNATFDVSLTSHLLFCYASLGESFHRQSLVELLRIAERACVYPLTGCLRERGYRPHWVDDLLACATLVPIQFRFLPGETHMAVWDQSAVAALAAFTV